jgi:hypothetical protein
MMDICKVIGQEIGKVVKKKIQEDTEYPVKILEVLYPNGIRPDQYRALYLTTKEISKLVESCKDE